MGGLSHTVSGDIASFRTPSRVPIESLKIHFLPKQEGSGDPSPINNRPITGWTGCNLFRTKKNLAHIVGYSAQTVNTSQGTRSLTNSYGTTISTTEYSSPDTSLVITQSETGLPETKTSYKNGYVSIVLDDLQFDQYYDISFKVSDILSNPLEASISNIQIYSPEGISYSVNEIKNNVIIFRNIKFGQNSNWLNKRSFEVRICGMSCTISEFMITSANKFDGIFEPYSGETIPISWSSNGVLYGGYVELITGKVWKTVAFLHFQPNYIQGVIQNPFGGGAAYLALSARIGNIKKNQPIVCSDKLKPAQSEQYDSFSAYVLSEERLAIGLPQELNTLEAVQNWMTNIGGFDVAYLISEPTLFATFSSTELKAFLDHNNFWSDANGITEVTYAVTESKDILETRKRISSYNIGDYIKDGLVLWMDGIDKGDTSGAWIDKIAGHVFTSINGMTVGSNHIALSRSNGQMLENVTFDGVNYRDGTIEVVISDYDPYAAIAFASSVKRGLCFGFGTSGSIIYGVSEINDGDYMNHVMIKNPNYLGKIFSINSENAIVDGETPEYTTNVSYFGQDYPALSHIGGRIYTFGSSSLPNYFDGKIYAIRVYNRKLSIAEMLHNQRIDNRRFNLNLGIS